MTEKLFYKDSHIKEFEASVITCRQREEKFEILLNRTAFFPEGGGQAGDTGFLNEIPILDTKEEEGEVWHIAQNPLWEGTEVCGRLDYTERFSKMQQHTGEHIVSGLIHQRFGYDNVGFHLGKDMVTMDFNGRLTREDCSKIEWAANEIVVKNLFVETAFPSREQLEGMTYRSKIEIKEQVRIVTIPGVDVCACCAPHVTQTGEIGLIKLVDVMKYKGGVRISMVCGFRALQDYRKKEESVGRIKVLLSAKPDSITEAVERQKQELQDQKGRMIAFQNKYLALRQEQLLCNANGALLFEEDLDDNAMRDFVNKGMDTKEGIWGAFTGTKERGYRYILGSRNIDMRAFVKEMHEALHGKGGGQPRMVQGSITATEEEITSYISSKY